MSIQISNNDQYADAISSDSLVVVKFSADWCNPCKKISPVFEQLADENPSARFICVNIEDPVSDAASVNGLPTFRFYKSSELIYEFTGASVVNLQTSVEQYLYLDDL